MITKVEINRESEVINVTAKKVTSPKVASKASKVLQNPNASKDAKSAAGSALSQREKEKK